MFAATPRLRDLLDARTVILVVVIALGAFGLQLLFLARTVASPLGGALADFETVPQVEGAPPAALAQAHEDAAPRDGEEPLRDVAGGARLTWEWASVAGAQARAAPQECLVYR